MKRNTQRLSEARAALGMLTFQSYERMEVILMLPEMQVRSGDFEAQILKLASNFIIVIGVIPTSDPQVELLYLTRTTVLLELFPKTRFPDEQKRIAALKTCRTVWRCRSSPTILHYLTTCPGCKSCEKEKETVE